MAAKAEQGESALRQLPGFSGCSSDGFPEYPPVESAAVCGQFLQLRCSPRRPERAGPDRRYGDQRPLDHRLQERACAGGRTAGTRRRLQRAA